jgi:hypothetical protein
MTSPSKYVKDLRRNVALFRRSRAFVGTSLNRAVLRI